MAEKELWELAANKRLDVRKHAYLQLTSLFLQQGKVERADSCFQEFVECSDSLELESEEEKEAKGTALYDYMYQKERGNQLEIDNKNDLLLILLLGMILLILLSLVAFYWQMSITLRVVIAPGHHVADEVHLWIFRQYGILELLEALVVVVALSRTLFFYLSISSTSPPDVFLSEYRGSCPCHPC